VVELEWQLGFDVKVQLAWGYVREVHPNLYRVWEESGLIKIRIRDKIPVYLKNEIP
jgi:hypothetical protein